MTTNKTWSNSKTNVKTERIELKLVQRKTVQRIEFHQDNYMDGKFLQEVQNLQHLVSRSLESIPPSQTDQEIVTPPTPLVAPVANVNIFAKDTVQLHMLELIKSLQEKVKTFKTNSISTTTKNEPRKRKNQ